MADIRSFFGGKGSQGTVSSQERPAAKGTEKVVIFSLIYSISFVCYGAVMSLISALRALPVNSNIGT